MADLFHKGEIAILFYTPQRSPTKELEELIEFQKREIARVFRVPLHLLKEKLPHNYE